MDIYTLLSLINNYIIGWPFLLFILSASLLCTVALKGIQLRYFFRSWQYLFAPAKIEEVRFCANTLSSPEGDVRATKECVDMSPFQAFINSLSSNIGNATLVGPAIAIFEGGPGALFWMFFIAQLLMAVRFSSVYLGLFFAQTAQPSKRVLGGPLLYLQYVSGGSFLSVLYALFCLFYILIFSSSFQAYSISSSLNSSWGVPTIVTATVLAFFVAYLAFGNAQRIAKVSEMIVPVKLFVFFIFTSSLLIYHHTALLSSLKLILVHAFTAKAVGGGALGFTVQQAFRFGVLRSVMGLEAGIGTVAIMFGATGSKQPEKDAIMSMLSVFITSIVCFISGLCIIVSGVWTGPAHGPALVMEAFATLFGSYGCWAVSFLTVTFGLGVLAAVTYIMREVWLFLTGGRFLMTGMALYALFAFGGALVEPGFILKTGDLVVAALLLINLYAVLYLLPVTRRGVITFMNSDEGR